MSERNEAPVNTVEYPFKASWSMVLAASPTLRATTTFDLSEAFLR